jgi:CSLREA domain-containing protein
VAVSAALAAPASAFGATILVSTETDVVDSNDGKCSLREAVKSANADTAPGGGAGECKAGSGTDTIELPAGHYTRLIAGNNEDAAATGDLDLTSDINIHGAGAATTTIDASQKDRVLEVFPGKTVTIEGVTITGGITQTGTTLMVMQFPTGPPGLPGQNGGGISNAGTLVLTASAVKDNLTGDGGPGGPADGSANMTAAATTGGLGGPGGSGGGIFSSGNLTLVRTTVTGNRTGEGGPGGIAIGGNPTAAGAQGGPGTGGAGGRGGVGGALHCTGGKLTISDSTISGNTSGRGGKGGKGTGAPGAGGSGPTAAGKGGTGTGGKGGAGGPGGGLTIEVEASITGTTVSGNSGGAGNEGGEGQGGAGGTAEPGAPAVNGGNGGGAGGNGVGGAGGGGAAGGGIAIGGSLAMTNVTLTANHGGSGGAGGAGKGGFAKDGSGPPSGSGPGGHGGDGTGGAGGNGGFGGGVGGGDFTLSHTSVALNAAGNGGGGGTGTATPGGAGTGASNNAGGHGAPGNATPGAAGGAGQGGGVATNSPAPLTNSVVAANTPANCFGSFTDGGGNIDFPDGGCPGDAVDPQLGALADNLGPTLTMAPAAGSPAIDRVPAGPSCQPRDQRGAPRPGGSACDAGAFEVSPPRVTTDPAQDVTNTGATLAGSVTPTLRAATYHFEFGASTSYGNTTPDQTAPAGLDPVAASAAVAGLTPGTIYHYRLVASGAEGSSAGADMTFTTTGVAPPPTDTVAPVFGGVSLTNGVFAVGPKATAVSARAKRGTTFRYTLSEAARVKIVIARAAAGRRKGKRCAKPTRRLRRAKKCTRFAKSGTLTRASKAGANKVPFSGRIGTKKLKPGRYRAVLTATDAAGNRSLAKTLRFRIVRR